MEINAGKSNTFNKKKEPGFGTTVKPVLRDHCNERPPVLKDHIVLAEGPTLSVIEPVTKDHLS